MIVWHTLLKIKKKKKGLWSQSGRIYKAKPTSIYIYIYIYTYMYIYFPLKKINYHSRILGHFCTILKVFYLCNEDLKS